MSRKELISSDNTSERHLGVRIAVCFIVVIVLYAFCCYQNKHIVVSDYIYESDQIDSEFDGYRIVQISDFHDAKIGKDNIKLINKIKECSPDIIVVTGDVVDSSRTKVEHSLAFINAMASLAPVYYVTGNHEYLLEKDELMQLLSGMEAAGVNILTDDSARITSGDAELTIVGLDDNSLGMNISPELIGEEDDFCVVLAHEPQYITNYAEAKADLVFTGHAHGGQVRLPFVGGIIAPGQGVLPKYTEGVHIVNDTCMVISRGIGNSIIPLRVFNYPEIVCVDLKAKK